MRETNITSYDKTINVRTNLYYPANFQQLKKIFNFAKKYKKKICFRGSAQSYGDQPFLKSNITISNKRFNKIIYLNEKKNLVKVQSGVLLKDLLEYLSLYNLTLKCIPGNDNITIGGAISNNVHGKDSHRNGFFCDHLVEIEILNSENKIIKISKKNKKFKLYSASQGQSGFIISTSICVYKKISNHVEVNRFFFKNINEIKKIIKKINQYQFGYIWINTFSKNKSLGQGYLEVANYTKKNIKKYDLFFVNYLKILVFYLVRFLNIQRYFFKCTNYFYFYYLKNISKKNIVSFDKFNFPHKKIPDFYKFFYPHGFNEIQFFVSSDKAIKCIKEFILYTQKYDLESFIVGIKLHKKNTSLINSFKNKTLSVGFDLDNIKMNIYHLTNISLILKKYACHIYFAKDSIFNFKNLSKIQKKNYTSFAKIKKIIDKKRLFSSNQNERLKND